MQYQKKYKVGKNNINRKRNHRKTKKSNLPVPPAPSDMILQKTLGNQAVRELFEIEQIQAKLFLSQPGDIYEQEADNIAEQVLRMKNISKQEAKKKPVIHRKSSSGGKESLSQEIESKISIMKGNGEPLQKSVRDYFVPRFGIDLENVRIHNNSNADLLSRAIQARAFTLGTDIFFAKGEYQPGTHKGRKLIAHELTHVIQQQPMSLSPIKQKKNDSIHDTAGLENEFDVQGEKTDNSNALTPYQSTGLAMRNTIRCNHVHCCVIQRDIKEGPHQLGYGKMELDFTKHDATVSGNRARETGYVKFIPDINTPHTTSIRFVQIVRTFDTSTNAEYNWAGTSEANRNAMMTVRNTGNNIAPGFYVDQNAGSLNPRTKKTDPTVEPYYDVTGPPIAQNQTGSKSAGASTTALLYDTPGTSIPLKFYFVTSAIATDINKWLGTALWGFETYIDAGKTKIKNEYGRFREFRGETTDDALERFNNFYKNPGTPGAPT